MSMTSGLRKRWLIRAAVSASNTSRAITMSGFHVRIATCCGNSQLHSMLNLIRMTTLSLHGPLHDRAELEASDLAEILSVAQEQHYAIYESIRSGDERSAESHARRHIRATLHSNLIEQATRGTGHD